MTNFSNKFRKIILSALLGLFLLVNFSGVAMAKEGQVTGQAAGSAEATVSNSNRAGAEAADLSYWAGLGASIGNYITSAITPTISKLWGVLVYGTAFLIGQLGGLVFQLGGYLLEIILDWNDGIQTSPLVTQGWTLLRNLANLGFVLAIIFIAFATMLRIESYGVKRLFVRLVVVAVLINFSLAISGVVLNFSDSLTQFFIELAAGKGEGREAITSMVENLATTISPQQLLNTDKLRITDYAEAFALNADFFTTLAGLIFASVFTILAAGGVIAIVATGFIRYFIITALLILAPLAWLSFVIPPIDYFKKWWQKLFQWSLFMPTIMFFLYLAIIMADKGGALRGAADSPYVAIEVAQAGYVGNTLGKIFNDYAGMMLAVATMIMGLIVGEKFSIAGASTGMAFAQMSKNWALGKARYGGGATVRAAARTIAPLTQGISRVPILGTMFSGASRAVDRFAAEPKGLMEERQKTLSTLSDNQLLAEVSSKLYFTEDEAAAYIKTLAGKKGKLLKKVDAGRLKSMMEKAKLLNVKDDVYKQRLDLVPDEELDKMVRKLDKKKFLEEVDDDMLKETRFVQAMSTKQKEILATDGSDALKFGYVEGLNNLAAKLKEEKKDMAEIAENEHIKFALHNPELRNAIKKSLAQNAQKLPLIKELESQNIRSTPEFTAAGIREPLFNEEELNSDIQKSIAKQKARDIAGEDDGGGEQIFSEGKPAKDETQTFGTEEFK